VPVNERVAAKRVDASEGLATAEWSCWHSQPSLAGLVDHIQEATPSCVEDVDPRVQVLLHRLDGRAQITSSPPSMRAKIPPERGDLLERLVAEPSRGRYLRGVALLLPPWGLKLLCNHPVALVTGQASRHNLLWPVEVGWWIRGILVLDVHSLEEG
jgi:hypothetical protein